MVPTTWWVCGTCGYRRWWKRSVPCCPAVAKTFPSCRAHLCRRAARKNDRGLVVSAPARLEALWRTAGVPNGEGAVLVDLAGFVRPGRMRAASAQVPQVPARSAHQREPGARARPCRQTTRSRRRQNGAWQAPTAAAAQPVPLGIQRVPVGGARHRHVRVQRQHGLPCRHVQQADGAAGVGDHELGGRWTRPRGTVDEISECIVTPAANVLDVCARTLLASLACHATVCTGRSKRNTTSASAYAWPGSARHTRHVPSSARARPHPANSSIGIRARTAPASGRPAVAAHGPEPVATTDSQPAASENATAFT